MSAAWRNSTAPHAKLSSDNLLLSFAFPGLTHGSGRKRGNSGFAGNGAAAPTARGGFIPAKHPYSRAGLPFLGREEKNCSRTTSKGCSHQVLHSLKPQPGVVPSPCKAVSEPPPREPYPSAERRCSRPPRTSRSTPGKS